jgi:uncharacterized protein YaaR (DUF327 family)
MKKEEIKEKVVYLSVFKEDVKAGSIIDGQRYAVAQPYETPQKLGQARAQARQYTENTIDIYLKAPRELFDKVVEHKSLTLEEKISIVSSPPTGTYETIEITNARFLKLFP